MRDIYIIVEGDTEQRFVRELMVPYFNSIPRICDKEIKALKIPTSRMQKGGNVSYPKLKGYIQTLLKQEQGVAITTFIDYFKIPKNTPGYLESQSRLTADEAISYIEQSINEVINNNRFFSYIQKHEFKALLFVDNDGFEVLAGINSEQLKCFKKIIEDYPNPEEINKGKTTAPSKRLISILHKYKNAKPFYSSLISKRNGIESIISRCPRFKVWI